MDQIQGGFNNTYIFPLQFFWGKYLPYWFYLLLYQRSPDRSTIIIQTMMKNCNNLAHFELFFATKRLTKEYNTLEENVVKQIKRNEWDTKAPTTTKWGA